MQNIIIQLIKRSPPSSEKSIARLFIPGTKVTKITYMHIKMLPAMPNHDVNLLKIFPVNIIKEISNPAMLERKKPIKTP